MNENLKKYSNRVDGLKELAHILIRDDSIMDAASVLDDCNNGGISGYGAITLMTELMEHCKESQVKHVVWLFDELLPDMYRMGMEKMLTRRMKMHARFLDAKGINYCNEVLQIIWKNKNKIRQSFVLKP